MRRSVVQLMLDMLESPVAVVALSELLPERERQAAALLVAKLIVQMVAGEDVAEDE